MAERILVVDDEEAVRRFASEVLKRSNYDVTMAEGGVEALQIIEKQPRFDLFVVDLKMPEMSGDELGRRIRHQDPDAKVLYFTGYSDELFERREQLWEHEAFLDKPVTIKGLLEAVSLLLFGHTQGPA